MIKFTFHINKLNLIIINTMFIYLFSNIFNYCIFFYLQVQKKIGLILNVNDLPNEKEKL